MQNLQQIKELLVYFQNGAEELLTKGDSAERMQGRGMFEVVDNISKLINIPEKEKTYYCPQCETQKEKEHNSMDCPTCGTTLTDVPEEKTERKISIVWSAGDVIGQAEQMDIVLTPEEVDKVLDNLERHHDCNYGITWETIDSTIESVVDDRKNITMCGNYCPY